MKRALPLLALIIALFSVGTYVTRSRARAEQPVLEVGQFRFTARDIEQRLKVLQFYFPNEKNLNARADLVRVYSTAQVLLDHGIPDLRDRVIAEDKRIDSSTLDPTGLARIKRIFDGDVEAYRRLFIIPVLAPRLFTDFAAHHYVPQAKSRAAITKFIEAAVKRPREFAAIAAEQKLLRRRLIVSEEKGLRFGDGKKMEGNFTGGAQSEVHPLLLEKWKKDSAEKDQSEAERWVRRYAAQLKVGEVSPQMVNHGEVWLAIKLLGANADKELVFDTVSVPKDYTEKWQKEQEAKVPSRDL